MPEVNFQITGVEAGALGLTPLLQFKLQVSAAAGPETVQALLLNVQIQIQPAQRPYTAAEKERLFELFGPPEAWGQTLRNRLLAHANATVGAFHGSTTTLLPVPCSYDLNLAAAKYFYALEAGEVSLLFLFSGSLFYTTGQGQLQVERISWSKECVYRLPVQSWQQLMEQHYPNSAWLYLQREVFDQLCTYKRRKRLTSWDETIVSLLHREDGPTQHATSDTDHASRITHQTEHLPV